MSDPNVAPLTTTSSPQSQPSQPVAEQSFLRSANLIRFFRLTLAFTGLACTLIICASLVVLVLSMATSREYLVQGLYAVGLERAADIIRAPKTQDDEVRRAVDSDVSSISAWVLDCTGAKSKEDFPSQIQRELGVSYPFEKPNKSSAPREPNHLERAILALSQSLASRREAFSTRADSAFKFWEVTSIVTITLGMFTTILVSMSSTEFGRGDGPIPRAIRILAIIFPALGTASAAVIAFYSPQAEWSQASRTLASLTQLHGQMAIGVWKLNCIKAEEDQHAAKVATTLDEWSRRYVDVQTVSTAAVAPTGAGVGGGQPTGGGGGTGQQPGGGGAGQQGSATKP